MLRKPTVEHKREAIVVFNPEADERSSVAVTPTHKRRVAAYARVSTEQDAQQNSYEAQIDFYTGYIQSKPEWEFVGIYSDEGITGTSIKHRKGFQRMVEDALNGKIDLILTKSISRFSRNTVDALTITRQLRTAGVEVYFEKENVYSMDSNAEMVFTILCTLAQEESRSISENVRWGIQRSMEAGKINLPYKSFLGYEKGKDGLPQIVEEEAKIIREIYRLYLGGYTLTGVAEKMMEAGHLTPRKKTKWTKDTVQRILTNEKYKGDARLQKTYTLDYLNKQVRPNRGERKQWYIKDSHDAIISPETFELVQLELKRRSGRRGRYYDSPFTGKIFCGDCGAYYGHRVWHSNDKYRCEVWICNEKYENGSKCNPPRLLEPEIERAFVLVANRLVGDSAHFIDEYEERFMPMIANVRSLTERKESVSEEISALNTEVEQLIHQNATHPQDQDVYQQKFNALAERAKKKRAEMDSIEQQISDSLARKENALIFLEGLKSVGNCITKFDISAWHALVENVKVMADKTLIFQLRIGTTITIPLEEVQCRK